MLGTPLGRILLDRPVWTYLLGPFFKAATPDQAAPLSATYREAGAVGALTVTDTESKLSTAGGRLVFGPKTVAAEGDPGLWSAGLARTCGRAVMATMTKNEINQASYVGYDTDQTGALNTAWGLSGLGRFRILDGGNTINLSESYAVAAAYELTTVLRSTGAWFVVRGGAFLAPTLAWVGVAGTAAVYGGLSGASGSGTLASLRVADLGGAWASDFFLATDRKATSAATDTITHTANCLVEHTITAATGVTQELWVRRTDASNGWIVRMDQAGSTIKLIELVAGVETERASTAQTWTNGTQYRIVVICDGTTITPYVANVAKTGYASATTNQSATTAYVDTAGVDLVSWPRTVALPTGV